MAQAVEIKPSFRLQERIVQTPPIKAVDGVHAADAADQKITGLKDQETGNKRNWVLPSMVIGGLIGGAIALRDEQTRTSLKKSAAAMKHASATLVTQLKTNPGAALKEWGEQLEYASQALKKAKIDASDAYSLLANTWQHKNNGSERDNLSSLSDLAIDLKEAALKAQQAAAYVSEAGKAIKRPLMKV